MAVPTGIGTIWQLLIEYRASNQRLLNTFNYVQLSAAEDYTTLANILQAWAEDDGGLRDLIQQVIHQGVSIVKMSWQPVRPVRLRAISFTMDIPGAQDGNGLPQNVSQVISRFGELANRRNQGAIHLPPGEIDTVLNGIIQAAQIGKLQAVANKMVSTIIRPADVLQAAPVLISQDAELTPQFVETAVPQGTIRVMRRRTVGVGQ
jgi:hypothetical protein